MEYANVALHNLFSERHNLNQIFTQNYKAK